jgi:hypothetical protein
VGAVFGLAALALALAGKFAAQRRSPTTAGTLPGDSVTFRVLVLGTIVLVGALCFLPATRPDRRGVAPLSSGRGGNKGLAIPQWAFAWGREGRQIIVIVAEHYIRPKAATRIWELITPRPNAFRPYTGPESRVWRIDCLSCTRPNPPPPDGSGGSLSITKLDLFCSARRKTFHSAPVGNLTVMEKGRIHKRACMRHPRDLSHSSR